MTGIVTGALFDGELREVKIIIKSYKVSPVCKISNDIGIGQGGGTVPGTDDKGIVAIATGQGIATAAAIETAKRGEV